MSHKYYNTVIKEKNGKTVIKAFKISKKNHSKSKFIWENREKMGFVRGFSAAFDENQTKDGRYISC